MNNKTTMPSSVRTRAWQLVRSGEAACFSDACSILARHAGGVRRAKRARNIRRESAQQMWWNR